MPRIIDLPKALSLNNDDSLAVDNITRESRYIEYQDLFDQIKAEIRSVLIGNIFFHGSASAPVGALACDGALIDITAYQDLFNIIGHSFNGGVEPISGKFKLPDGQDRYLRGSGNTAIVGTYEEDSIKSHHHSMSHSHTEHSHSHGMNHSHGLSRARGSFEGMATVDGGSAGGAFSIGWQSDWNDDFVNPNRTGRKYKYFKVDHNPDRTDDTRDRTDSVTASINNYTGYTQSTGESETRVKGFRALMCIWYS